MNNEVIAQMNNPKKGLISFDLSKKPVIIEKGKDKTFNVQLDIISGAGKTIKFDIVDRIDILVIGQLYGGEIKVIGPNIEKPIIEGQIQTISN